MRGTGRSLADHIQYLRCEDIFIELEVAEVGVDHVVCQGKQLFLLKKVNAEGGPL